MNTINPQLLSTESPIPKRSPKWNSLIDSIANGSLPFPTDCSPPELKQLIEAVATKRRERLRRFIAGLIARQMVSEKARETPPSEQPPRNRPTVHPPLKSGSPVPSRQTGLLSARKC